MLSKLKIAIIHPWDRAKWTEPLMWDGLHAMLREVGKVHQVDWFLQGDKPSDSDGKPDNSYDWIIPWGVGSIPFNNTIEKFKGRKALLCAGHPQDRANFEKFEAIFVESPKVYEELRQYGHHVVLAFGTDTDFFKPRDETTMFNAFFPATFSPWKRQSLFAGAAYEGSRFLACGLLQPDGINEYRECLKHGVYTMEGLIPTRVIAMLYNMSEICVITAWHGSERTTLEAMASNIPLIITKDNELACSLTTDEVEKVEPTVEAIKDAITWTLEYDKKVNTREYVLEKYTHHHYAQKLLEIIES